MTWHNKVWAWIVLAGWLAVFGSAILTDGFTKPPTWRTLWQHEEMR
ncbi:MAG: hypothetical protein HY834_08845 [Devosia nanyangense]|uniref:Uncharacterized protein n=1 Tax=Devosia nanyangense TaxID=1228055 RepID=A0A933L2Y9_9HYPH|nr:hypothetical protein [Devosia nanyangense]